ncbi:hypothetical protein ACFWC9_30530 [Streptomyces goshikiensis]
MTAVTTASVGAGTTTRLAAHRGTVHTSASDPLRWIPTHLEF